MRPSVNASAQAKGLGACVRFGSTRATFELMQGRKGQETREALELSMACDGIVDALGEQVLISLTLTRQCNRITFFE